MIHLLAIAGRVGVEVTLEDWDALGKRRADAAEPQAVGQVSDGGLLLRRRPSGDVRALGENGLLNKEALTVNGKSIWENCQQAANYNADVIMPFEKPLLEHGGIAVLRGNLAPDGAVLKPSAASPHLLKHRGRAVVFETIEDYHARIGDPNLDVDATCVLVLKNCGPKGYPGMAEVGNMGLPPKVLETGVTDMVRISDARMSGTAYGTVVLHVCPEAAVGGPLALVKDGDMIELDVPDRSLTLEVSEQELAKRRASLEGARAVNEGRVPGAVRQPRAAGESGSLRRRLLDFFIISREWRDDPR